MRELQSVGIVHDGLEANPEAEMLAEAARSLGFDVAMFGRAALLSPALRADVGLYDSSFGDATEADAFAAVSNVITYAGACPSVLTVRELKEMRTPIFPTPSGLAVAQHSLQLEEHLAKHKIPALSRMRVQTKAKLKFAEARYRNTLILKAGLAAENIGQSNLEVTGDTDWEDIMDHFGITDGHQLMLCAEPKISIVREFLVMGSRHAAGRIALYPVVEIVRHKTAGKLLRLLPDPDIDPATLMDAGIIGEQVIESFGTQGLFAVTMFEDPSRKLWVDKVLPHAHALGNFTVDATLTPQYMQQIRAVTGMEPGRTDLISPAAVTVDVPYGASMEPAPPSQLLAEIPSDAQLSWNRYDTPAGVRAAKAGYVTVLAADLDEAERFAVRAYNVAVG